MDRTVSRQLKRRQQREHCLPWPAADTLHIRSGEGLSLGLFRQSHASPPWINHLLQVAGSCSFICCSMQSMLPARRLSGNLSSTASGVRHNPNNAPLDGVPPVAGLGHLETSGRRLTGRKIYKGKASSGLWLTTKALQHLWLLFSQEIKSILSPSRQSRLHSDLGAKSKPGKEKRRTSTGYSLLNASSSLCSFSTGSQPEVQVGLFFSLLRCQEF